ncbi:MAG: NB-ARC domain-containing protein, partial [Chloroflexota bacterium]
MLTDLIQDHIKRCGYSYGEIATLSQNLSPTGATLLPKSTVQGWVKDYKPTLPMERLLVLARVLDLTASETNELLAASKHHSISRLLQTTDQNDIRTLLTHWDYRGHVFQAPREPVWFVGREDDKQRVKQILRHSQGRLCFLYGEGGIGKSALAIRLAHEMRSEFPDGILWAEVNGEASLLPILRSFAACYDYPLDQFATAQQAHAQVRSLLQAKSCLIILDNIATAQELDSLLPAEGSCATLVTLRDEALAKHYYRGTAHDLPRFALSESTELLMEILGLVRVQKEMKAAQQLIGFADGLPLVLRLIGCALRSANSLSLQGYAKLLNTKLAELIDWERLSDRERKVRATFEVSYQRLLTAVQPLFASLGVFQARHFSTYAVAHINNFDIDETRLLLAQLAELSLIQAYPLEESQLTAVVAERYQMHTLLQLFAYDKLLKHAPYLYEAAQDYYQAFVNNETDKIIDYEWLNIAGFIQTANHQNALITLATFMTPLTQLETSNIGYMDARGHYTLAFQSLSALLTQASETEQAVLHYKCGVFALRLGQRERSLNHLQNSEALLKKEAMVKGVALQLAAVYEHLARLTEQKGGIEDALSAIKTGLDILAPFPGREIDLQKSALIVVQSTLLCRTYISRDSVIAAAKQSLQLASQYDNVAHLNALTNLAIAQAQKGRLDQARDLFKTGIEFAKRFGNKRKLADFCINLGIIARRN